MAKKSKFVEEFKTFISRGNVIDLAVGVIIGGAFSKIVTSFVNDVVMPLLGLIIGGISFVDLKLVLKKVTATGEPLVLSYGLFLQAVVDFLLLAFVLFIVIKGINSFRFKKEEEVVEEAPPAPPQDIALLTEIRDLLKKE